MTKQMVLLVDDDPAVLEETHQLLAGKGYDIKCAGSGKEAIELLNSGGFSLVITDLFMDGIDGLNILKSARKADPDIMVIIMTGSSDMETALDVIRQNADDYLLKPYVPEEICFKVEKSLKEVELKGRIKAQARDLNKITKELSQQRDIIQQQIEENTLSLRESNAALKVLLDKKEQMQNELEDKMLFNIRELVLPYLDKMKRGTKDEGILTYISIIEANLKDLFAPFEQIMPDTFLSLSPREIKITNLVKLGKTTKDISKIMNLSPRTIESYRNSVRKKIGIKNKRINLRTFLLQEKRTG